MDVGARICRVAASVKSSEPARATGLTDFCHAINDDALRAATNAALGVVAQRCPWSDLNDAVAIVDQRAVSVAGYCAAIAEATAELLTLPSFADVNADVARSGALLCRADLALLYEPGEVHQARASSQRALFAVGQLGALIASAAGCPDEVLHVIYYTSPDFKLAPRTAEGRLVHSAIELAGDRGRMASGGSRL